MKSILLGLAIGASAAAAGMAADTPISFAVEKSFTPTKIPDYFFGAGREQLNINKPKENQEFIDERIQIMKDLKLRCLRGPCGTEANFYLWKKGHYFTSDDPDYSKYFDKKDSEGNRAKGPGSRPLTLKELYEEAVALDVPYVFDVNVISQSPEDVADLVVEIKKLNARPIFLEMGNELFEPGDNKTFPLCKDYIGKVRAIRQAVNAVEPSVKIGVVCPAYPFSREKLIRSGLRALANTNNKPIDRYLEWDQVLAANQDAFDAVILHPYVFFRPENATQDSLMAFMFAWNTAGEEVIRKDYAKLFPSKKIWITEFNVLTWAQFSEKDKALKNHIQMMKSPGAAVINMESILGFLNAGNVDIATIHTFVDGQGFGVIERSWGNKEKGRNYDKLPNYYVFEALGKLFASDPYYYRMTSNGSPTTDILMSYKHVDQGPELAMVKFNDFAAWGFGDAKGVRQVVILNRTMTSGKVGLAGHKLRKVWSYGGRQAIPEFLNYSREWTAPPAVNPEPDRTAGAVADQLELAPYSMTIAEIAD